MSPDQISREIEAALPEFTGTIIQVPPAYSALKIDGERAYDLAREGEEVVLEPREIEVHRLALIDVPDADTECRGRRPSCSRKPPAMAAMSGE